VLYLNLRHSPNLTYPEPKTYRQGGYFGVKMATFESLIPLDQKHLDEIMDNLYTSRFVIDKGRLKRYTANGGAAAMASAKFHEVPEGTYEFYRGVGEKVRFQGVTTRLPEDHPLNSHDPDHIQELFNIGIEMHGSISRDSFYKYYFTQRYAYFHDGDFYLMGAKVIDKDDFLPPPLWGGENKLSSL